MKLLFLSAASALIIALTSFSISPQNGENLFQKEFLSRINAARHKGCNCGKVYFPPAPPMVWNDQLEDAANGHAKDMSRNNYFSHTSQDGRSMSDRVVAAGYGYKGFKNFSVGENIAQGQTSISEVMDGWLHSEGHCRNLMNPAFKEVGVAETHKYWVQDFGGREPFSKREQELMKSGHYRIIQRKVSEGH